MGHFGLIWALLIGVAHGGYHMSVNRKYEDLVLKYNSHRMKRDLDRLKTPYMEQTLGMKEGEFLDETDSVTLEFGKVKVKFQETYMGIPVMDKVIVAEKRNGKFSGKLFGSVFKDVKEDIKSVVPELSIDDVLNITTAYHDVSEDQIWFDKKKDVQLFIYIDYPNLPQSHARLVYFLSYVLEYPDKILRPFFIIDANTGDIIQTWDGITSYLNDGLDYRNNGLYSNSYTAYKLKKVEGYGGNVKTGKYKYGEDYPDLEVYTRDEKLCKMENEHIRVINKESLISSSYLYGYYYEPSAYSFNCKTGTSDEGHGAYSPINDAFFFANVTYNMYKQWFNVTPLTSTIKLIVHDGEYDNAKWDGTYVRVGDGKDRMYPLSTSRDIMAHEISHAYTEQHSGLIYSGHSECLNEAFSDMAGKAVEFFHTGTVKWSFAADVMKDSAPALRFMDNPSADGKSIGNYEDYCPDLNGHFCSGVFNKAFFLLSNTEGWDVKKAFHVFLLANTLYWTKNSQFAEAACKVVEAAKDLEMEATDVTNAFQAVGITPCVKTRKGLDALSDISLSAGDSVEFTFDIPSSAKSLRFETRPESKSTGDVDISVKTVPESYELSSTNYGNTEVIDIGSTTLKYLPHVLTLKTTYSDVSKVDVYAITSTNFMNKVLPVGINGTSYNFTLPDEVIDGGEPIMLRVFDYDSGYNQVFMAMRHGGEVDIKSGVYDQVGLQRADSNGKYFTEIMICKPQRGKYHLHLEISALAYISWYDMVTYRHVTLSYETLLRPRA